MLTGTLRERDGMLFVVYESPLENTPKLHRFWWKVYEVRGDAWNAYRPEVGDTLRSQHDGWWHASREGVYTTGSVCFPQGLPDALTSTKSMCPARKYARESKRAGIKALGRRIAQRVGF